MQLKRGVATVTCTSTNWSTWVQLYSYFNLSITSTASWTGRIEVQRKFNSTSTQFMSVDSFTGDIETYGVESEFGVYYRVGIGSSSDYTSGKIYCRLSQ